MIVYADIVFLVNFAFDMEILLILLKIASKKAPPVRLFLSACLGGVQGVFAFVPYFRILAASLAGLMLPLVMTVIVLYPSRADAYVKGWLLFMGCAFLLSGMMQFFNIKAVYGLLLPLPVYTLVSVIKKTALKKKLHTRLYYGGKSVCIDGFLDSGNKMTYMGTPVILAREEVFAGLFGKGFTINAVWEWADKRHICAVPYRALGREGTVIGVRLDMAEIGGKKYDDIILGCFADNLSEDLILNGTMI